MRLFLRGRQREDASLNSAIPLTQETSSFYHDPTGRNQVDKDGYASSNRERDTVSTKKKRRPSLSSHDIQKTYGTIEDLLPELIEACSDEEGSRMHVSTKEKEPWIHCQQKKDVTKGTPVYMEETGERLGTIVDLICDPKGCPISVKIKDERSQIVQMYTLDQFESDKRGLIFLPGWYTKTLRTIKKLEFKERTSPWLSTLLLDDSTTNSYLNDFLLTEEEDIKSCVDEVVNLKKHLLKRLDVLEQRRASLKKILTDITEKRLMGELDRIEFSEEIRQHKRRIHIVAAHLRKGKQLVERLDQTIFSTLARSTMTDGEPPNTEKEPGQQEDCDCFPTENMSSQAEVDAAYKEKYEQLKLHYDQLNHEHQELKMAVEKLMYQK